MSSVKVSDYIFQFVRALKVRHVFYLPGGGAMHLDDSLGHTEGITPVCMLHEQGCAIAAEAYSRITGGYGVCVVTSGPGATNALTGAAGAWLDGTPVIFISGQVKRADLTGQQHIRQFGIQEIDIVNIVKGITKYAVRVDDSNMVLYELEKAVSIAMNGKRGPVWLDVPLDVQQETVDTQRLVHYSEELPHFECKDEDAAQTIKMLRSAKRPLLILGSGVRQAGARDEAMLLAETLGIPVMTSWNGADLIEDSNPLFFGRPGASAERYANVIQQVSDFVLTVGTRLNLVATGFDYDTFLKDAVHVMVEIDAGEMDKKSVHPALKIQADALSFFQKIMASLMANPMDEAKKDEWRGWVIRCRKVRDDFHSRIPEQTATGSGHSTYDLIDTLSDKLTGDDVYQFTSSGTCADIAMQRLRIKKGMRAFLTKGLASMGFDLPASIGSCLASGNRRTVCVTGDGGFMMNIQELATLARLKLPVKMFVVDNSGYSMIYTSQQGAFGRLTGCNEASGLHLPDICKVASAFGIRAVRIGGKDCLASGMDEALRGNDPCVCVVEGNIEQRIVPRQANYKKDNGQMASRPLQDMTPLLDEEELLRAMRMAKGE